MRNIDYEYVAIRKKENDWMWKNSEKDLYFCRENENYIIPNIVLSIILFFMNPVPWGFVWIGVLQLVFAFGCYMNNVALDYNPSILSQREAARNVWEKDKRGEFDHIKPR